MTKFIDCMLGHHDAKTMKLFQLEYRHKLARFSGNKFMGNYAFRFKNGMIKNVRLGAKSIHQWMVENKDLQHFLLKMAEMEVSGYR